MVFERTTDEDRYLIKFQKFTKVYSMVDTKKVQKKSDELDSNGQPISIEEYNERLREEIFKSGNTNKKERLARLKMAPRKPASFVAYSLQYKRNPDVIVEVLERAKGICEECGNPAPFIRTSDGTPYLEVHHIIPLSKDGEDTVENGVALCPNCHRKAHFGN
ncbi:MAG: hypothetical protein CVU89_17460 [Firmicutes bacterium HGW-Firmicutes-14]|nr:MAG: hypothetical protein CVU89_17460 [Firmicutes bacterium HGW-Firmicutes-14]